MLMRRQAPGLYLSIFKIYSVYKKINIKFIEEKTHTLTAAGSIMCVFLWGRGGPAGFIYSFNDLINNVSLHV